MSIVEAEKLIDLDPAAAVTKVREVLAANPTDAAAYRILGAALRRLGQDDEASRAELSAIETSGNDPDLVRANDALKAGDYARAEFVLRAIIRQRPTDVMAIQLLGEVATKIGLLSQAEAEHRRALSLAPDFHYARLHLANVLNDQGRPGEALAELRTIKGEMRDFLGFKMLLGDVLSQIGDSEEAIDVYREILATNAGNADVWSRLAFLLQAWGKRDEAIETCRAAIELSPTSGKAWSALSNIKTYHFSDDEMRRLEDALVDPALRADERARLHFVVGKALEDRKQFQAAFDHYRSGNELRAAQVQYHPESGAALLERIRTIFTKEFLDSRAGTGDPSPDPIFIVGMPRAGSTLVEQILASQPQIEGTAELPDLHALAVSLQPDRRAGPQSLLYLDKLPMLSDQQLHELGRLYLERTRIQRKTDRPFFIDKLPSNWAHVGFIKLILPNAKIIDARRHPLACGFSNYKQLFGRGQEFAYDLSNIGSYYRHYVDVMEHFDAVAPGFVHRVIHEQLVADPEGVIRRLLDFIGLPFDEACLRFHETERSIRTPSSEQVRQPLRPDFTDRWKAFEAELAPLKEALGQALEHWDDPQSS